MESIEAYLPINALLYERVRPETKLRGSLRCCEDVQELFQPLCPFPYEPPHASPFPTLFHPPTLPERKPLEMKSLVVVELWDSCREGRKNRTACCDPANRRCDLRQQASKTNFLGPPAPPLAPPPPPQEKP